MSTSMLRFFLQFRILNIVVRSNILNALNIALPFRILFLPDSLFSNFPIAEMFEAEKNAIIGEIEENLNSNAAQKTKSLSQVDNVSYLKFHVA